jgi:DNA-directed RNA polymerase subunit M/transcription elongation factor TFIIS
MEAVMPRKTSTARTGVCSKCKSKYTSVMSLESLSDDNSTADLVAFECPRCGHANVMAGVPGQRIVKLRTRAYLDN